ncbi:hypothetical protein BTR22_10070 [Alkalihalophilus pseudofirmus]|uniref:hypothetical protein n=1 Tax=Alkalihalophilus pseudofirmus TaxID=79885 RepID=UPI000952F8CD|nr:hypothetical protein BTR22_10070 [Alkalihalophilus pseudofirmus]
MSVLKYIAVFVGLAVGVCIFSGCDQQTEKAFNDGMLSEEQLILVDQAKDYLNEEEYTEVMLKTDTRNVLQSGSYQTYLYTAASLSEEQFKEIQSTYFASFVDYSVYLHYADSLKSPQELFGFDKEQELHSLHTQQYAYYIVGLMEVLSPRN